MQMINIVKKVTATLLALSVIATSGVDVQAKTVAQPKQTRKSVIEINSNDLDVNLSDVTNLKINGKKFTKSAIKKKVKTVTTATHTRQYRDYKGSYTVILDSDVEYDSEKIKSQKENYKYITTYDYKLDFLKPGTYKISYDSYSVGDAEEVKSADGKTMTVTPILEKTSYVKTYKVLPTLSAAKSISLGKSQITTTITKKGSKVTTKEVIKNRYLTGASGKLNVKMNSNYKFTSAYAVTRNAQGYLTVSPVNNKGTVTYSVASASNKYTYDKVVPGADGKDSYVEDKDGYNTKKRQETVTGESNDKYKLTEIYYGYQDKFTGAYTKYAVSSRTVYLPTRTENGDEVEYQKNPDGSYVYVDDAVTGYKKKIPVVTPITATVLTTSTLEYMWFNGTYQPVEVVTEMLISPTAKNGIADAGDYDGKGYSDYWIDVEGKQKADFGVLSTVSVGGVPTKITLFDGTTRTNPAYTKAIHKCNQYEGSWQIYAEGMKNIYTNVYDIDATTGKDTTRWVYVCNVDEDGDYISKKYTNVNYFGNTSGYQVFYAK